MTSCAVMTACSLSACSLTCCCCSILLCRKVSTRGLASKTKKPGNDVMIFFKQPARVVLILFLSHSWLCFGQELSGHVVAESGEPLAGVRVLNLYLGEATT